MLSPPNPSRASEFSGDSAALYEHSEESISLRELLTIAFREKRKAIVAFFIPVLLAIVGYFIIPPSYTAETTLMVRTGPEYLPTTESSSAPSTTKQEQINSEIEILQSRYVAEEAIRRVGLARIYPKLSASRGGSAFDNAVKSFSGNLKVGVVKLSNVISVSFKHKDAAVAKSVLDAVIAAFDERHVAAFSNNQAQAYQQDIDQDVAELQTLSKQREQIRKRTNAFDVEKQRSDYLARLKDVQTKLQELDDRKDALNARLAYLHGARSADPTMTTSFNGADEMGYVQNSLSDLKRTEATLLSQYAPDHPRVQAVQAEIKGLESRIATLGNQEAKLDAVELAQYPKQAASYKEQVDELTARLQELEGADADLHALDARIKAIDDNLKLTRDRFEQARVLDDMNRARLSTSVGQIQPPITSQLPTKPRKAIFFGIGLLLGIVCASGIVIFAIATNNTIVTSEGVERVLGLPVLVAVPRVARPPILATPQRE